jgi:xanthine/uracil permease
MSDVANHTSIFDVGIHQRMNVGELIGLGLQNILGMTGMFIFPGLIGLAYHLPPTSIAYLYGVTFVTSGLVTVMQSVVLLRLPIIQGPYAGTFAALLVVGHMSGGLGTAFGSLFVAALIWCVLTIPIKYFSLVGYISRYMKSPLIYGVILLIIMTQLTNVALPNWIGTPTSPGFPWINLLTGAIAVLVIIVCTIWERGILRRGAVLWGILVGTIVYAFFAPISFSGVMAAPVFAAPRLFPFGFGVNAELVFIFFITFLPAIAESISLYEVVAEWGAEPLSTTRISQGVFGEVLGSAVGAMIGGISTLTFPDNVGMLRATRVGSRYVTLTAGLILIVLGCIVKFDLLLVAIPMPILSAAGTLLFGMIIMSGVQILGRVHWDNRNLIVAGLPFTLAIGGLFIPAATAAKLPFVMQIILNQPLILGTILLLVLHFLLNGLSHREVLNQSATTEQTHEDVPHEVVTTATPEIATE